MSSISYKIVSPDDKELIGLIAKWYSTEWNIPEEATINNLSAFPASHIPFQMVMTIDDRVIATGGIYTHVGLLDIEPRFKVYGPWLALVFTSKENRNKGYGALLCKEIEAHAKDIRLKELFLFTHTAESLYRRLNWKQMEKLHLKGKNIVVMKKEL